MRWPCVPYFRAPVLRLHSNQNAGVKAVLPLIVLLAALGSAVADVVPLPRPRPTPPPASHDTPACAVMNTDLAIAAPLAILDGPGECAVTDAVRLEAVVMPDGSRVVLSPPATLRCSMAEAMVHWVREDMAAA